MMKGKLMNNAKLIMLLSATSLSLSANEIIYIKHANSSPNAWSNKNNVKTITSFDNFDFTQNGEYWIANGDYSITKELNAKDGVKLIGGFSGDENSINDRLRSDINGDGITSAWEFSLGTKIYRPYDSGNKFRMFPDKNLNNIGIDGLIIENTEHWEEGSIIKTTKNLIIENSTFVANGGGNGGVISFKEGIVSNSWFIENRSYGNGSAIKATGGVIEDCLFEYNKGGYATVHITNATIRRSIFDNNHASNECGGVWAVNSNLEYLTIKNGYRHAVQLRDNSTLQYSLIHNNFDPNGFSGVVVRGNDNKMSHLTVTNNSGGGIVIDGNKNELYNSVLIGNSEAWDHKLYKNLETKNGNSFISYVAADDHSNSIYGPTKPHNIEGFITPKIADCFFIPTSFVGQSSNQDQELEISKSNWRLRILSPLVETGSENMSWFLTKDLDGKEVSTDRRRDIGCYRHTTVLEPITVVANPKEEVLITQDISYDTIQINKDRNGLSGAILNMSNESIVENSMLTLDVVPGTWYFISFPFQVEEIIVDGNSNPTYYEYFRLRMFSSDRFAAGESIFWGDIGPVGDNATNYIPRIKTEYGYIFAVSSNKYDKTKDINVTFVAPKNNNEILKNYDVSIGVVSQSNTRSSKRGWNLVTNPYAAHYNADALGVDAMVWNNQTMRYELTNEIKPFESFFVQVDETKELEFYAIARISHHYPIFDEVMKLPEIEIHLSQGSVDNSDYTLLRLSDDSKEEYTIGRDLSKMTSLNTTASQLHTTKGDEAMMANSITWEDLKKGINIKSVIKQNGLSTLSIGENELTDVSHLWLIDQEGKHHDLLVEAYTFDAEIGEYNFRIQAEIIPLSNGEADVDRVKISSNNGVVTIDNLAENAEVTLFDINGRAINKQSNSSSAMVSLDANNEKVVILEVKHSGKKQHYKVAVN
ncbi:MAG: right-handed parallel beta-helix repeat-containing protein [Bacteroidales bacterium]